MLDFTLTQYAVFLDSLLEYGFSCLRFCDYLNEEKSFDGKNTKIAILRHDVDRLPLNALKMAQLENARGIQGTYYFRIVQESFDENIIKAIAGLGHEIGYHYEDVDLIHKQMGRITSDNYDKMIDSAFKSFCSNLAKFRRISSISTICMHGSPRSKYDNKLIWERHNYKDLELIGEPYLDLDFSKFTYLTDTGRRWNGHKVSVRDKVAPKYAFDYKKTQDIILNISKLSPQTMFTLHPERWKNNLIPWMRDIIWQNIKNQVKWVLIKYRGIARE
jgi:hypothetical protein